MCLCRVEKPTCISSHFLPGKIQLSSVDLKLLPNPSALWELTSVIPNLAELLDCLWVPVITGSGGTSFYWREKDKETEKMTHPVIFTSDHSEAHKGLSTHWRGLIPPRILLWPHWDQTQHSKHVDAGRFSVVPFVFLSQTLRIFFFTNPSTLMTWIRKNKFTSRFLFSVFLSTTWC